MGNLLPHLTPLWMQYRRRILSLVLLLFIEVGELPMALVFLAIGVGLFLRFHRRTPSHQETSERGGTAVLRNTAEPVRVLHIPPRQLVIEERTLPSRYENAQTVKAYIASGGRVGEKLCGVFALVDGRFSTENEEGQACSLVTQVLDDVLQEASSNPTRYRDTFKDMLVHCLEMANSCLYQRNQGSDRTLSATVTALVMLEEVVYIAHLGMNRLYLY